MVVLSVFDSLRLYSTTSALLDSDDPDNSKDNNKMEVKTIQ
jgi:hypothetical protein